MSRMDALATATLDELPLNVAVLDGDGDIRFTNRAWREFGETTGAADPGTNYFGAIDTSDDVYAERAVAGLQSVLDGRRELFTMEYPCHTPDRRQWFLMRATRVDDAPAARVLVVHVDITERKLAEIASRRTTEELRAERRSLEHLLERIDGLLGNVTRVLVSARSREEVERRTCEEIVGTEPFVAAWVARPDLSGSHLTVTARATRPADAGESSDPGSPPDESDLLPADGDSLPADGDHPAALAATTGEVRIADDPGPGSAAGDDSAGNEPGGHGRHASDDPATDGRATADRAGRPRATGGSLVAVPLAHREEEFGVLVVHADRLGAFDERERAVLAALGRALANAVRALVHEKLLVADTAIELVVETGDRDLFFVALSADLDATLDYEGSVYRADDSLLVFLAVPAGGGARAAELAADHPTVLDADVVSEGDSQALVEFAVRDSLLERLADAGGAVRELGAESGRARLRAEFPDQATARAAFERLAADHGADLLGQRERERPARTAGEFRDDVEDALTDRQLTVLRKAHASGFFDWPRPTTGDELAGSMGIARSTFHQHLRAAERKLIEAFFER